MNHQEMHDKYGKLYETELLMEARYKQIGEQAVSLLYSREKGKDGDVMHTVLGQKFVSHQFNEVKDGMRLYLDALATPKRGVRPGYALIVDSIRELFNGEDGTEELIETLAMSVLSTTLNLALHKEYHLSNIAQNITKEVYDEIVLKAYLKSYPDKTDSVLKGVDERVQAAYRKAYARARMKHDNFTYPTWETESASAFGASLIDVVCKASSYFELVEAPGSTLEVRPSQALLDSWSKNEDALINNAYRLCPMVIPPRPWTSYSEGGYVGELQFTSNLLRLHETKSPFGRDYLKKLDQVQLDTVLKAINAIQATPWKINTEVLEVIETIVERGGGWGGVPFIDQAPKPMVLSENPSEEEVKEYRTKMTAYYELETTRKSLALRALSHVRIAREFKNFEAIYFPTNMDFRGRVYPIPSFNCQGDDLNKGLILFSDVPGLMKDEDVYWFYVQVANLAGVDKVSFNDRVKWVQENEDNILASAYDPLGYRWWAEQDEPVQFLAICLEYRNMVEYKKEHNTLVGWKCSFPHAYDGTCSGLQHFSAILRDPVGANAVNLIPADKPSDIYGIVAAKVNKVLEYDAINGTEDEQKVSDKGREYISYGTKTLALQWLAFGVNRKVTKRNVMTLAYGSKEYGFRDQLNHDFVEPDVKMKGERSVFAESKFQASGYLAKLTWNAVGTTVVKAVEGMKWLQTCAKLVTKNQQVVTWVTPAGLPVQQNYMAKESTVVRLRIAGRRIRLYSIKMSGDIDKSSQASGIAPNFIHSMDACHLQLCVNLAHDRGIRHFAMIHDSYGCPLAQTPALYQTIRESFIRMYQENDVLEDFRNQLQCLTTQTIPNPPIKDNLDLSLVMESKYIFS